MSIRTKFGATDKQAYVATAGTGNCLVGVNELGWIAENQCVANGRSIFVDYRSHDPSMLRPALPFLGNEARIVEMPLASGSIGYAIVKTRIEQHVILAAGCGARLVR